MDAASIEEWLNRRPFAPFRMKLSNQETLEITNPDLVVVMKRDIFVAEPTRDRFHLLALMHVVGLESGGNGG